MQKRIRLYSFSIIFAFSPVSGDSNDLTREEEVEVFVVAASLAVNRSTYLAVITTRFALTERAILLTHNGTGL